MRRLVYAVFLTLPFITMATASADELPPPPPPVIVEPVPVIVTPVPAENLGNLESIKPYTPRRGDFQLLLSDSLPIFVSVPTAKGAGPSVTSTMNLGLGYCGSDMVEFGAALGFALDAPDGGPTSTLFDIQPFLKLNIGGGSPTNNRLNPYLRLAVTVLGTGGGTAGSSHPTYVIPAIDLGLELMVTRTWGINLFIPVDVAINVTTSNAKPVLGVGLGYGVVTYF